MLQLIWFTDERAVDCKLCNSENEQFFFAYKTHFYFKYIYFVLLNTASQVNDIFTENIVLQAGFDKNKAGNLVDFIYNTFNISFSNICITLD